MLPPRVFVLLAVLPLAACGADDAPPAETDDDNAVIDGTSAPPTAAPANEPGAAPANETPPEPELVVHSLANLGDSISQGFDADDSQPIDLGALQSDPNRV